MTVATLTEIPEKYLNRKVRSVKILVRHAELRQTFDPPILLQDLLPRLKREDAARVIEIKLSGSTLVISGAVGEKR